MPLPRNWSKATNKKVARIPSNLGVYEVGYNKHTIRIGSGNLRSRIQTHVRELPVTHFRFIETNSRVRAVQLERKHLTNFGSSSEELPKYNDEIPAPPQ